jgi:hypothetical protein
LNLLFAFRVLPSRLLRMCAPNLFRTPYITIIPLSKPIAKQHSLLPLATKTNSPHSASDQFFIQRALQAAPAAARSAYAHRISHLMSNYIVYSIKPRTVKVSRSASAAMSVLRWRVAAFVAGCVSERPCLPAAHWPHPLARSPHVAYAINHHQNGYNERKSKQETNIDLSTQDCNIVQLSQTALCLQCALCCLQCIAHRFRHATLRVQ